MVTEMYTNQLSVLDLLPNQLVFTQRIPCFTSHHVDWTFINLLFDCSEQHEQRFPGAFLHSMFAVITYISDIHKALSEFCASNNRPD